MNECYCTLVRTLGAVEEAEESRTDEIRNHLVKRALGFDLVDYVVMLSAQKDSLDALRDSLWLIAPLFHLQYRAIVNNFGIVLGVPATVNHCSCLSPQCPPLAFILISRSVFEVKGEDLLSVLYTVDRYLHVNDPPPWNDLFLVDSLSPFDSVFEYPIGGVTVKTLNRSHCCSPVNVSLIPTAERVVGRLEGYVSRVEAFR